MKLRQKQNNKKPKKTKKQSKSRGECNFNFQRQVINKSKRNELKAAAVASAIDSLRCE